MLGANAIITKPFEIDALLTKIGELFS